VVAGETSSPRQLRFLAGLTLEESGQLLGFTERTAKWNWAFARVWLYDAMKTALGRELKMSPLAGFLRIGKLILNQQIFPKREPARPST